MSSVLLAFGSWIASKLTDKGFDATYDFVTKSEELTTKFNAAIEITAEKLQKKYPDLLGNSISYFFKREETFNELIKLLFKLSKVNVSIVKKAFDTTTLPPQFISSFILALKKELLKDVYFDKLLADKEAFLVLQGIGADIKTISGNTNATVQELKKIQNTLAKRLESNFNVDDFLALYKQNATNTLSQVNFIGLGIDSSIKKNRKNLQDVFVRPLFESSEPDGYNSLTKQDVKFFSRQTVVNYDQLLDYADRLVILGNPGAGKSVLIKSLICEILNNVPVNPVASSADFVLPFRIELRKYLAFKKEGKGNFIKYLLHTLDSEYFITNLDEHIISYLLNTFSCVVFFDGLDEIFDIKDKIGTKTDIENFHNKFTNTKSVVTSRIIGYEEASLNETFKQITVSRFNDDQVSEYVNKWYLKEEENQDIRKREVDDFLSKKSEIDIELLTNPLLLSLIVIIYRNILKIPESKLEIYQSCTKTLVDKWDASKELQIDIDFEIYKNKEKIFADLAHWQYIQLSIRSNSDNKSLEITYEKAKKTVAASLVRINLANEDTNEELAETFMNYALRRSIYFDNNFTHKTFLEYYTAYWIYSNIEKKHNIAERNEIISKYITNPFWFIVLELLLNLIDKDQPDNEVIDEIVLQQLHLDLKSLPFFLTIVLKLKNISSSVVNDVVRYSINQIIENPKGLKKRPEESQLYNILEDIFHSSDSSKNIIIAQFIELEKKLSTDKNALILLYILYLELNKFSAYSKFELSDKTTFNQCCHSSAYLFWLHCCRLESEPFEINLIVFYKKFGINAMFKSHSALFDEYSTIPLFYLIVYRLLRTVNTQQMKNILDNLEQAGLSKDRLLKKLLSNKDSLYNDFNAILNMMKIMEESKDLMVIKILLALLPISKGYRDYDDKRFYEKAQKIANESLFKVVEKLILSNPTIKERANLIKSYTLS